MGSSCRRRGCFRARGKRCFSAGRGIFGGVWEERWRQNRTSALSGMKAKGLLLVFDSYCSSIVVVDILNDV